MPKTIPPDLIGVKNRLDDPDPWLFFLHVVLEAGVTEFYIVNNTSNLTWDGQEYTKSSFRIDFPDESTEAEIGFVQLTADDPLDILSQYAELYDGGLGGTVTITQVHADNLDLTLEDYSPFSMTLDILGLTCPNSQLVFKLGFFNLMLAPFLDWRYIPEHCNHVRHFKGLECGYSGGLTTCNGTYTDCQARSNTKRFGGFLGLGNGGYRIA